MKLTNEVFNTEFLGAVNRLLKKELPVQQSFLLRKFAKELEAKFKVYEEARIALAEKHAKKDKEGNPMFRKNEDGSNSNKYDIENIEEFNKEFKELSEIEENYSIEKLVLSNNISISAVDLGILENIIEDSVVSA